MVTLSRSSASSARLRSRSSCSARERVRNWPMSRPTDVTIAISGSSRGSARREEKHSTPAQAPSAGPGRRSRAQAGRRRGRGAREARLGRDVGDPGRLAARPDPPGQAGAARQPQPQDRPAERRRVRHGGVEGDAGQALPARLRQPELAGVHLERRAQPLEHARARLLQVARLGQDLRDRVLGRQAPLGQGPLRQLEAQRHLARGRLGQVPHERDVLLRPGARRGVDDAERAEDPPVRRPQRRPR
jgi:hypothetical protein